MFCSKCGTQNAEEAVFCNKCGAQLQANPAAPTGNSPVKPIGFKKPNKGMAIASMVIGIISIALFMFETASVVCSIVGIVLSTITLTRAKYHSVQNGMAVAGLVCSIAGFAIQVIITSFVPTILNNLLSVT